MLLICWSNWYDDNIGRLRLWRQLSVFGESYNRQADASVCVLFQLYVSMSNKEFTRMSSHTSSVDQSRYTLLYK